MRSETRLYLYYICAAIPRRYNKKTNSLSVLQTIRMSLVYGYTLISSAQDARHYRILSCPISGLQALVLVRPPSLSSSSSSTAYVAAAVAAGSFYDPDDAPGLAHLVEHLVFLGSHN